MLNFFVENDEGLVDIINDSVAEDENSNLLFAKKIKKLPNRLMGKVTKRNHQLEPLRGATTADVYQKKDEAYLHAIRKQFLGIKRGVTIVDSQSENLVKIQQ